MKIELNVTKVIILRLGGPDQVLMQFDGSNVFPAFNQGPVVRIDVARGLAEEWLLENFGIKADELITEKGSETP